MIKYVEQAIPTRILFHIVLKTFRQIFFRSLVTGHCWIGSDKSARRNYIHRLYMLQHVLGWLFTIEISYGNITILVVKLAIVRYSDLLSYQLPLLFPLWEYDMKLDIWEICWYCLKFCKITFFTLTNLVNIQSILTRCYYVDHSFRWRRTVLILTDGEGYPKLICAYENG